jgi:outer membrane protein OmpA-like peptidoglycan-associated protein
MMGANDTVGLTCTNFSVNGQLSFKKTIMKIRILFLFLWVIGQGYAQQQFTIYFDTNSDQPNEVSEKQFSDWIKENKDAEIHKIYGYADSIGNDVANLDLSRKRTLTVTQKLTYAGMLKTFEVKTYGESESKTGPDAESRKVVIWYTKPEKQKPILPTPVKKGNLEPLLTRQVREAKKGDKLELAGLNFYGGSGTPLPESEPLLRELLDIMKSKPALKIQIQGHICCVPFDPDRIALSRAKTVYDYLVRFGIDKKRLSYKSLEGHKPLYPMPEENEQQKIANRRVEIEIVEN